MSTRIHTINSLQKLLRSVQGILLEINNPPPHPPIQACKTNLTHMHARTHIRSDIHTHTNIPARTHKLRNKYSRAHANTHRPHTVRQRTISAGFALNCRGSLHHGIRPRSRRRRGGGARTWMTCGWDSSATSAVHMHMHTEDLLSRTFRRADRRARACLRALVSWILHPCCSFRIW